MKHKSKLCPKCKTNLITKTRQCRGVTMLKGYCGSCHNVYQSIWRQTAKGKALVKRRKQKARNFINRVRAMSSCVRCGESDTQVLEFDHIDPKTKSFDLGSIQNLSLTSVKKEMRKCQILCRNCHLKKTLAYRMMS